MEEEIWKDIIGYEGLYQASTLGNIRSLNYKRTFTIRNLIGRKTTNGYLRIDLFLNKKNKSFPVHKLIANTFIINENNKPYINHINGIKTDNRLSNLEWCTASENALHSFNILGNKGSNLGLKGILNTKSKKVYQYDLNLNYINQFDSIMDIKRSLGINPVAISMVCNGKRKTTGGFIFKFNKIKNENEIIING